MEAKQILVVDDDDLVCWALQKELSALGLVVHGVDSGDHALTRLQESAYQLAFLEVELRDANGLNLIGTIREAAPQTRVVMLSSEGTPANKRIAFERGAYQFIDKPFDLDDVLGLVSSTFGDHREKRGDVRYLCRLPLRLTVVPDCTEARDKELPNLGATTIEVSRRGMRLRTAYPLEPGQCVRVSATASEYPCAKYVPTTGLARVIWSAPGRDNYHIGLRYLG